MVLLSVAAATAGATATICYARHKCSGSRSSISISSKAPQRSSIAAALLVTPAGLATSLASTSPPIVIELASPPELKTEPGRIPGSHRVWRPDYQLPLEEAGGLDGLVPTAAQFQTFARGLGVNERSEIVIVDRKYDATRLWWLFWYFGKAGQVRLLDGGFQAWVAAGHAVTLESPAPPRLGTWTPRAMDTHLLATRTDVINLAQNPTPRLWDIRTVEEYTGSTTLKGAARPGRIPWNSARIDWNIFRREDGCWRSPDEVAEIAKTVLGGTTPTDGAIHTFYCQSGVRTTQLIFGMAMTGWPLGHLRNYDGSWVEWSHLADERDILVGE